MIWTLSARLVCAVICCAVAVQVQGASFQGIGGTALRPTAISADGSVVVGYSETSPSTFQAYRWTQATGVEGLGFLAGGNSSTASAVTADGSVIFGNSAGSGGPIFQWTQAGGMTGLGSALRGAPSVSADGSIIAAEDSTGNQAVRWTQLGGPIALGHLAGGSFSTPDGISADGSIIVGSANSSSSAREAFRWSQDSGMVGLGFLNAGVASSEATAISADGSVIVGYSTGPGSSEAFRWTQATGMVGLGFLSNGGDAFTTALAVSGDGSVIVGNSSSGPFVWDTAHGLRNLTDVLIANGLGPSLTDWKLVEANAISADGLTIAGLGTHLGADEDWVAHVMVVPEPPTWALLAGAMLALVILRCHRKVHPGTANSQR